MTFKMSEVFELPVKKTQGGVLPFLKDCNPMCNTIFVGNDDHVDASVIAINAYDANQESLKKLRGAIFNINNDNIDLSKEITDQKRQLDDKVKLIKGVDKANSEMAQEIAELKQLAETKNARTLERIGRIERQEREISALKNQISQLKYENSSMAAYAERRISMLTRVNNKLREGKS